MEFVNSKTVQNFIDKNPSAVVMLGASWCFPCKRIKQKLPVIQEGFDVVRIAYLDVDEAQEFAKSLNIMAVPTFALYSNGKLIKTIPTSDENVIRELLMEARKY
jgi:thioredoxin 1